MMKWITHHLTHKELGGGNFKICPRLHFKHQLWDMRKRKIWSRLESCEKQAELQKVSEANTWDIWRNGKLHQLWIDEQEILPAKNSQNNKTPIQHFQPLHSERIPQTRHSKILLGFSLMFLLVASSLVAPGPLGEKIRVGATSHKLVAHVNLNGTVCTLNLKWHIVLYHSAVQVMLIVQACAPANWKGASCMLWTEFMWMCAFRKQLLCTASIQLTHPMLSTCRLPQLSMTASWRGQTRTCGLAGACNAGT